MLRMAPIRNLALLLLLVAMCHHGSAQQETQYYITSNPDTPCPAEPCLTLDQFTQKVQHSLTSNITLILLPGDHNLTSDIKITDVNQFAMLGSSITQSPPGVASSRIVCTSPASITLENIRELVISSIATVSCGSGSSSSAVRVRLVEHFELSCFTL